MKNKSKHVKKTPDFFIVHKKYSKFKISIFIIIYLVLSVCTTVSAHSPNIIMIGETILPVSSFAGVFSSIANACLIMMLVFYKKSGFITSLILLALQFPIYIGGIFTQHNLTRIPGLFSGIFTIITLIIIFLNQRKMEKGKERMQNLFEQTATALVNSIDAKDKYTHGHSARVAEYSRKLAEMNGKSEQECEEVYYAALLHDVGKIGVPDSIINKAGKLTEEEYEIIKQHPIKGAQILETINEYPYLSIGAHYHHERYDGNGYPEKLKGDEIPEIARIVAVADAYDTMTSMRSYRDPIPQDKVREEIVKGIGTQFDPEYAKLMIYLIDIDIKYEMKEITELHNSVKNGVLTIDKYRSTISSGILISSYMSTIHLSVTSNDEQAGIAPVPSMILFDSLDGIAHFDEEKIADRLYFEYGEIWFDGRTAVKGARKIQTNIKNIASPDIKLNGEYKIEAVRRKDHALIRIVGKMQVTEIIVALPDSTRYLYIGLTGEHCQLNDICIEKAETEFPLHHIPRIAEQISYINVPAGDIPNVQIDGFCTDASEGIEIKNDLQITFHTKSLPTARLIWHCPFIDIFCSDDGKIDNENYRNLAFMRFDGECCETDPQCSINLNVVKNRNFKDWDTWKKCNQNGFDAVVTFKTEGNKITIITENAGISIKVTITINNINKTIYAAITGDQVAITNIQIH